MSVRERYFNGEQIPARDFNNNGGLKFFGEVVYLEWLKDKATSQEGLDGEAYWQKVKRVPGRTERPTEVQIKQERNEIIEAHRKAEINCVPSDAEKLVLVRHQLRMSLK